MPYPNSQYGIVENPAIYTPFVSTPRNDGQTSPTPSEGEFLLSSGGIFLLSSGENFNLQGD